MTRLRGTGEPDDDEYLDPRKLAAQVPRYGHQRHPDPDGESTENPYLLDEPTNNTLSPDWRDRPGRVDREPLPERNSYP